MKKFNGSMSMSEAVRRMVDDSGRDRSATQKDET